jgi:transglutaminase-like putative cysteine protease
MKRSWSIIASGLLCLALTSGCGQTPQPEKKTSQSEEAKPPSKPRRAPLDSPLGARVADMIETPSEPSEPKTTTSPSDTKTASTKPSTSEPSAEPTPAKKSVAAKEPMPGDTKTGEPSKPKTTVAAKEPTPEPKKTEPAAEPSKPKATVAAKEPKKTEPAAEPSKPKTTVAGKEPMPEPKKAESAKDPAPRVAKATPSLIKSDTAPPKVRRVRFEYGGAVTAVPAGKKVQVWLPYPPSNDFQKVTEVSRSLPGRVQMGYEFKYGNQVLYFETVASAFGEVPFQIVWDIERKEVKGLRKPAKAPEPLPKEDRQRFLAADRRVPTNDPKALALLGDEKLPQDALGLARVLYDTVDEHVTYDTSKPGYGTGDVRWVCGSRFGDCTDFHSLFNSLARSNGLPSFLALGFPLPTDSKEGEIAGYHCWAFFYADGHGWVPVDVSEANKAKAKDPGMKDYYFGNLTADRITFTVGRDIDLGRDIDPVPKQAGEPLNYFIYPYAEVDGKPYGQVRNRFRFADR